MRRDKLQSRPFSKVYRSNCNGLTITGSREHIEKKYEALAYEALGVDDRALAQTYFQHADHYKKMEKEK